MEKVSVNGIQLAYDIHGEGEPILMVHGFPHTHQVWEPMISPLGATHRLIMPDLRGMGESQATADAAMADYADDLAGLLDAIDEERPVVVMGMSMGGYIAFEFWRRHRDRVRGLVLVDTRAEADTPEGAKGRLETAEKVRRDGSRVVAEAMTPKLFKPGAPAELIQTWRELMEKTPPEGVAAALKAMASRPDSTATLGEINVPTLVVVGKDDAITTPDMAKKIHSGIKGSKLEVIEDAGHMTPVEQPEAFAEAVLGFLAGLEK